MKNLHFAILVWRDFSGLYHARWVEDDADRLAVGPTATDAVRQVRDYLGDRARRVHNLTEPDLIDPSIIQIVVDVRPEYRANGKVYPCGESIRLPAPCVRARRDGGMWVCLIPFLGVGFDFWEADAMKRLVGHYVQDRLGGLTPRQISRYLPPPEIFLETVVVRAPGAKRADRLSTATDPLGAVLDTLPVRRGGGGQPRCWEREAELNDLVKRLTVERANVIVVAEPGCGKSALIHEAIRRVKQAGKETGGQGTRQRFYRTSAWRIIAGMKYLGQWQARCEKIIERLQRENGTLCVENLSDLAGLGGHGAVDSIAAFLQPFVERGELRLVGEAGPGELDALRRLLPGFTDIFQVLRIAPFSRPQALAVLQRSAAAFNSHLHLQVDPPALECVYRLFTRFEPYGAFPGKPLGFLQGVFDHARRHRLPRIDAALVSARFTHATGLPELILRDEVPLRRSDVLEALKSQVVGQDPACQTVADVILSFKAGLNDPNRPLGVLLFCGPTGVGKTQLAKAMSRFLFEHGQTRGRLIRLDMSEFAGPLAAARLTGEGGGAGASGARVRQQPFTVVLLDEIEKADPRVFDVLLRVLDEGRLTDALGRATFFNSAVIIMTSNLGAGSEQEFGFSRSPSTSYFDEAMRFFRPEFVNRIDAIVNFAPLSEQTIHAITVKELGEIAGREGLARRNLRLTWTDDVVRLLAVRGYDKRYGARPLQRTLEELVVAPLSGLLLRESTLRERVLRLECRGQAAISIHLTD